MFTKKIQVYKLTLFSLKNTNYRWQNISTYTGTILIKDRQQCKHKVNYSRFLEYIEANIWFACFKY